MTKQLTLNENIQPFFEAKDKQIWDYILENKIDELLNYLPRQEGNTLDIIISELLTGGKSDTLEQYDFKEISETTNSLFRDMERLVFALDINGNYEEIRESVVYRLFEEIPDIVEKIQKETTGYPTVRRVADEIIKEAAAMRASLNNLVVYYQIKEDTEALHFAIVMRTKLTLAIMSNYKNVVGHDMIEAAKIKETVGDTEAALVFYNAAKENLKGELHWFIESPEMGANEDDQVILSSLKEAYLSIDRLKGTSEFTKACAVIDEILSREYVEYDFDEEDDDDEE
ncbi:hypothetical protein [Dysgonomonas sp. 521]|uniref:hypothetical protein n=1 Tax=Dysgonomonas sp. 521 TaxID=2302932 RepID=UPI00210784DD|nr:hypothetical protein [Dysgonomonas sp. 521]